MLKYLSIKNLILIKDIEINFEKGLTVFTGETGAGKSMILDSLAILSGSRIKSSLRPSGGKKTTITGIIDVSEFSEIKQKLLNIDVEFNDEVIIKRVLSEDGKSKSFINDILVSLNTLKEVTDGIIEVHSQFSEQGLLDSSSHLDTLVNFGTNKQDLQDLKNTWDEMLSLKSVYDKELKEFQELDEAKKNFEEDLREFKSLNPISGEFEELEKKKKILKNYLKISETLNKINMNFISENPPGIEMLANENMKLLNSIENMLDDVSIEQIKNFESNLLEIAEISKYFQSYLGTEGKTNNLESIEERIFLYKKISKKHNVKEQDLFQLKETIQNKVLSSDEKQKLIERIKLNLEKVKNKYLTKSKNISDIRIKNSKLLDSKVNGEFKDLKLEQANFKTFFETTESSPNGNDKVTFKIQTNPKSNMDEIKNISSGGELCRIALALKVTSDKNILSTLLFDEVDSGIGGAVSSAVGQRLKRLGNNRQVCVITHSPQVASIGNNHYKVVKNKFETSLEKLNEKQRVLEIARMLSAKQITEEATIAAKKLIDESN